MKQIENTIKCYNSDYVGPFDHLISKLAARSGGSSVAPLSLMQEQFALNNSLAMWAAKAHTNTHI